MRERASGLPFLDPGRKDRVKLNRGKKKGTSGLGGNSDVLLCECIQGSYDQSKPEKEH